MSRPLGTDSALARLLRSRRMIRAMRPERLDRIQLDDLLDLARRGPSAGHSQAAEFVVLDQPDAVERYWAITLGSSEPGSIRQSFQWPQLLDAPVLVLVTTNPQRYLDRYREADKAATGRGVGFEAWPVPYWWVDAGAVIQNLLLLAHEAGWGACLFGPFDHEDQLKREFSIDPGVRIVGTVALGHPLPDRPGRSANRPWRPRSEIIQRPGARP